MTIPDIIRHSGYLCVNRNNTDHEGTQIQHAYTQRYAYDFIDGELVIHAYESIPEIYDRPIILGHGYDNTKYLFCLPFGFEKLSVFHPFPRDMKVRPEFVIKDFTPGTVFNEARICFDELQYFCPSEAVVSENDSGDVVFLRSGSIKIKEFEVSLNLIKCQVKINLSTAGSVGFARSHMEAVTEIIIHFTATDNLEFISNLYHLVDMVFSFICNRRNTTFRSMKLSGLYHGKMFCDHKQVECDKRTDCEVFFYDRYREEPEGINIISKTWNASYLIHRIDKLFQIVAQDIDSDKETGGYISINSIHPSIKRRNLIDLQQSLQITGAFEFYVRKYLPSMVEEKDHHRAMKKIFDDIISDPSSSGKLKKLAKSMSSHIIREPALEDKIWKAYKGYTNWTPLKNCILEEWFSEDEIKALGHEANEWRNELAHSKRSYEPSIDTIRAIRLIEHFNYAIVLRQIGYDDEEIKGILKEILVRNDKPQNQNETQMQPIDGGKNSDNEPIEETKDSSAESGTE